MSDQVSLELLVEQSSLTKAMKFSFRETQSGNQIAFCVLAGITNEKEELHVDNTDSDSEGEGKDKMYSEQHEYFVHSQCLTLEDSHIILCSCERTKDQGIAVRLHDMKLQQSVEIGLFLKSNGQFAKLQGGSVSSVQLNE